MSSHTEKPHGDANEYARKLEVFSTLRQPVVSQALAGLDLPSGGRGMDLGCGIGLDMAGLLKASAPGGRLTCVDASPAMLKRAQASAEELGLAASVDFRKTDVYDLPFAENSFDWIWSVDCAGMIPGPKALLIKLLCNLLKRNAKLMIMAWTSQRLLPGYPELEAKLNATPAGYAPYDPKDGPQSHFLWAGAWLREAGMSGIRSETIVRQICYPLSPPEREAMLDLFDMRWGRSVHMLSPKDRELYAQLCGRNSQACILDIPGYAGFFTYTLFIANRP